MSDELLLTPKEQREVDDKLLLEYKQAMAAYKSSEGFSQKPKLPTGEDAIQARLEAQLAKVKQHSEVLEATIQLRIKQAVDFIESYFLTTKEAGCTPIHHIDDAEWRKVKDKLVALIPDIEKGAYETNIRVNKILSKVYQQHKIDIEEAKKQERKRIIKEIEREAFAEPQYIPQSGRELVTICLTVSDLQALKEEK